MEVSSSSMGSDGGVLFINGKLLPVGFGVGLEVGVALVVESAHLGEDTGEVANLGGETLSPVLHVLHKVHEVLLGWVEEAGVDLVSLTLVAAQQLQQTSHKLHIVVPLRHGTWDSSADSGEERLAGGPGEVSVYAGGEGFAVLGGLELLEGVLGHRVVSPAAGLHVPSHHLLADFPWHVLAAGQTNQEQQEQTLHSDVKLAGKDSSCFDR